MQQQREQGNDDMVKVRVLRKPSDYGGVSTAGSPPNDPFAVGKGWEVIEGLHGTKSAVWKGYIDLAGYTREEQTWFTRNVQIQGTSYPSEFTASIDLNVPVYDIISEVPLSDNELAYCNGWMYPGDIGQSTTNLQQIIFGRVRIFSLQTTLAAGSGTPLLVGEDFFGLNNGTARDKLYLYKVIGSVHLLDPAQNVIMGNAHFVVSGAVDEEPDLEYIMRLKRSYEIAGPFS